MIHKIPNFYVLVYNKRVSRVSKFDLIGRARVVGAIFRPYWHPYMYSAYHVIFDDGRKETVWADHCVRVSAEEEIS
ncbi:hypothetical protein F373_gp074 [Bacillus phage SP-10]|uniref:hypothetical protein n=1 Tax=Bacillus phage SP10 TaxID=941058 RepID=UPI0002198B1E|nr:hypothetical protein F373_gp074 [Bacillus phage SP-10]BAK52886.1 hypothetical protein [Bacillus phage SP-10]